MVKSRRTTLGAVSVNRDPPNGSADEAQSQKSSSRRQRMSMAPRMAAVSVAREGGTTPSRRKSLGVDRRQSVAAPAPAPAMKRDPRPIMDHDYKNACIRNLAHFLVTSGYEYPVTQKNLKSPSGKDFNNIVTFLLRKIDPTFNYGGLKFEDEVAMAFKAVGYPFPISKTALVAAGTTHTWPTLLAALTWLIELLECTDLEEEQDLLGGHAEDTHTLASLAQLEARTVKAFFQFLGEAYESFLAGDDERNKAHEGLLVEFFENDNMVIEREIERVTDLNGGIVESIESLGRKGKDLPELMKRREDLATDLEKFRNLVNQLNDHKADLAEKVNDRTASLASQEECLTLIKTRLTALRESIHSQHLSVDDVRRMQKERVHMEETIQRVSSAKQAHNKKTWEGEMELSKQLKQLAIAVDAYNSNVGKLQLALEASTLIIRVHEQCAHEQDQSLFLGGVDIESDVLPALSRITEDYADESAQLRSDLLNLLDRQEASEEALAERRAGLNIVRTKKESFEKTLDIERKDQNAAFFLRTKEVESLEAKVASLQNPLAIENTVSNYMAQASRLDIIRIRSETENIARKKAVQDEFNAALSFCAEHKEYLETILSELKIHIHRQEIEKVSLAPGDEQLIKI